MINVRVGGGGAGNSLIRALLCFFPSCACLLRFDLTNKASAEIMPETLILLAAEYIIFQKMGTWATIFSHRWWLRLFIYNAAAKEAGAEACLMTSKAVRLLTLGCKALKLYNAIKQQKVGSFPRHNLIARMCLSMENKGIALALSLAFFFILHNIEVFGFLMLSNLHFRIFFPFHFYFIEPQRII